MSSKPHALLDEARYRLSQGDCAGGIRSLKKLLRSRPGNSEALYLLGVVQLREGRAAEAVDLITRAIVFGQAKAPALLENLGAAYFLNGDLAGAERELRRALAAGGTGSLLYMRLGIVLAALKHPEEAEKMLREAQHQDPENSDIGINLGNVLAERGLIDAALEQYSRVLGADQRHLTALFNIGTLNRQCGRLDSAIEAYHQLLSVAPDHIGAMINLGTIYEHLGKLVEAEQLYKKVLSVEPDNVLALSNLSSVLLAKGWHEDALSYCRRAIELSPDFTDALVNLGSIHAVRGQLDVASRAYHRALQLAPEDHEVRSWCGTLELAKGEFIESSWLNYQARQSRRHILKMLGRLDDRLPEHIGRATVLLVGEQGIGDELFFLRYADVLNTMGARVLCVCDTKIRSLLERTGIFAEIYSHGDALPKRDITIAVGDIPLVLLRASKGNGPCTTPLSLQVLPDRVVAMRSYLERFGPPPYLALTWRAGTPKKEQLTWREQFLSKEVSLEALASAIQGFQGTIVSVQRNPEAGETEYLSQIMACPVWDASAINGDLENMLALIGLIQEYVGVSNTNMHLLAGLGRRARVLMPNPPDWRWMATGMTSPWFPLYLIYRQASDGSWGEAMKQLAEDLHRKR